MTLGKPHAAYLKKSLCCNVSFSLLFVCPSLSMVWFVLHRFPAVRRGTEALNLTTHMSTHDSLHHCPLISTHGNHRHAKLIHLHTLTTKLPCPLQHRRFPGVVSVHPSIHTWRVYDVPMSSLGVRHERPWKSNPCEWPSRHCSRTSAEPTLTAECGCCALKAAEVETRDGDYLKYPRDASDKSIIALAQNDFFPC